MNILLFLLLGGIAGWLASVFMKTRHGILIDVILGVVGAFIGGLIMNIFGAPGVTGFDLYSILVAFIGAVVLIALGRLIYP